MKNPVKNWSLSALQMYESCPAKYKAVRIDKIGGSTASPAMERGTAIHSKAEHYLLGDIPTVPKELQKFKREFENLRKAKAIAEEKRAYTKDWKPTGFMAKDAWLRLVVDACVGDDFLIDFKTGRIYADKHNDQAELYSTPVLLGGVEAVTVEFWYLDQDCTRDYTFTRSLAEHTKEYWEDRVAVLFSDTKWHTTPSKGSCKYCPLNRDCPDSFYA